MEGMEEIKQALGELREAAGAVAEVKALRADLATMREDTQKMTTELRNDVADLQTAAARPRAAFARSDAAQTERKAVAAFVRTGDETELKAMSAGSNPDGGFTVLPQMADAINSKTFDRSPLGRLARRVQIDSGNAWQEPFDTDDIEAAWVAETAARPALGGAQFSLLNIPLHEVSTTQVVTQKLLDLSTFDLGAWLEAKIADKFARAEAAAFVGGDGVARPKGLLTYATAATADASRAWGTIEHLATGVAGDWNGIEPAGTLIEAIYALRAPYRLRARWLMNSKTAGFVRRLQDGSGAPFWSEGLAEGQPSRLLGYPVELDEEMPDIAADALAIAFGDFQTAYTVVEHAGVRMLRDPYTDKPNVIFYGYRRIGGGLANSEAVKLIKFAAA